MDEQRLSGGELPVADAAPLGAGEVDELVAALKAIKVCEPLAAWCDRNRGHANGWPGKYLYRRARSLVAERERDPQEPAELFQLVAWLRDGLGSPLPESHDAPASIFDSPPPVIRFNGSFFVITGTFAFGSRGACERGIRERGGHLQSVPAANTSYVVIGAFSHLHPSSFDHLLTLQRVTEIRRDGWPIAVVRERDWVAALERVPTADDARPG